MAAKKAKGDDWFSSLDAELDKKTKEIIEDVGEQNVARLELNKTLIEDFWKVWKRFNKINVHFAMEPSYTNWAVFPDTFPDGDWRWRPGFDPAAVDDLHRIFAELVRVWYESHLRRNREVLIKFLKQTYEKVETFNQ